MTRRKDATKDVKRLDQLRAITEHPNLTNRNGERLISEATLQETNAIAERLGEAIRNRNQARTAKRAISRQRDQRLIALIRNIRLGWDNLKLMVQMGQLDEASYPGFGLGDDGRRPNPGTIREWLMVAEQMSEETNPEIPSIERETFAEQVKAATEANLEAENAEVILQMRQGDLKEARIEADKHLRKTASKVKSILYDEDPISQRRTMRTYGYRFEGEQEPETETTEAT